MRIIDVFGVIMGAALVLVGIAGLVFLPRAFASWKRQFTTLFGTELAEFGRPAMLAVGAIGCIGVGAVMFALGITSSFA